jgi:hypothetical protein
VGDDLLVTHPGQATLWGPSRVAVLTVAVLVVIASGVCAAGCRNVIERRLCHMKQWRGLATGYDKLAIVYCAATVLDAIIAWTKALSDAP